MSPCCLSVRGAGPRIRQTGALAAVKKPRTPRSCPSRLRASGFAGGVVAESNNRLSISTCRSARISSRACPWAANAPLAFIDQYIQNLRRYRAIAVDVGDQDNLKIDTGKLHDVLTNYGIKHDFEIYSGTHTSNVAVRFQENVMPFFSRTLSFESAKR